MNDSSATEGLLRAAERRSDDTPSGISSAMDRVRSPRSELDRNGADAFLFPLCRNDTLEVPMASSLRSRSRSPDAVSLLSVDDFPDMHPLRSRPYLTTSDGSNKLAGLSVKIRTAPTAVQASWKRNKGLAMVIGAQFFASLMTVCTALLEREGGAAMHPFQLIFARMLITLVLSTGYMWWKNVRDFPFGAKDIRWLLVARGIGGFAGVFGVYYSVQYLSLADATVLTFLAPFIASYVCSKILKESFTLLEQIGGAVSFTGVVLICRPTTLFSMSRNEPTTESVQPGINARNELGGDLSHVTNTQRFQAIGMSMIGVIGAVVAYTMIRWIGQRAHPLISVNYFATWCMIASTFFLLVIPDLSFALPQGWWQWLLLSSIGICGFLNQVLLTTGLAYEKSGRAQNMVYSQMLFALAADKVFWGTTPGMWSWAGSILILGSALVVAVQKESSSKAAPKRAEEENPVRTDEEQGLVGWEREDRTTVADSGQDTEGQELEMEERPLEQEPDRQGMYSR